MFDQLHTAYRQMQPGDKMVMQLHKSPKPPQPTYQTPGAPPTAPPNAGGIGAPLPDGGAVGGSFGSIPSGGTYVPPDPPPFISRLPDMGGPFHTMGLVTDPNTPDATGTAATPSPTDSRQALIRALADRIGARV